MQLSCLLGKIFELTSSVQAPKYEPLQALLMSSSTSGSGKYDFVRSLVEALDSPPQNAHEIPKWDLIGEILQKGRESASLQLEEGKHYTHGHGISLCGSNLYSQTVTINYLAASLKAPGKDQNTHQRHFGICESACVFPTLIKQAMTKGVNSVEFPTRSLIYSLQDTKGNLYMLSRICMTKHSLQQQLCPGRKLILAELQGTWRR